MINKKSNSLINRALSSRICLKAMLLGLVLAMSLALAGCELSDDISQAVASVTISSDTVSMSEIPEYEGTPFVILNDNVPSFDEAELTDECFEKYSKLDKLGRCSVAYACLGTDTMPDEERGSIGMIKPSGWHTARYDGVVENNYLYNRCHLIAFMLSGENDNERNLITGTRYMNTEGMLPFEISVADYIRETDNHVMYRVTPIFESKNLLASGVQIEALSVEDGGKGISINVFCYNVQPDIIIDYKTGESELAPDADTNRYPVESDSGQNGNSNGGNGSDNSKNNNSNGSNSSGNSDSVSGSNGNSSNINESDDSGNAGQNNGGSSKERCQYVINMNTKKFHRPECPSVDDILDHNRWDYEGTRDKVIDMGYEPCQRCDP